MRWPAQPELALAAPPAHMSSDDNPGMRGMAGFDDSDEPESPIPLNMPAKLEQRRSDDGSDNNLFSFAAQERLVKMASPTNWPRLV